MNMAGGENPYTCPWCLKPTDIDEALKFGYCHNCGEMFPIAIWLRYRVAQLEADLASLGYIHPHCDKLRRIENA